MSSSDELRREHVIIERVLEGAELLVRRLRRGEAVPEGLLNAVVEFFAAFVCGCHHLKEEEGVRPFAPGVAELLETDHAEALRRLETLRRSPQDPDLIESYVAFERAHLAREVAGFLPHADRVAASPDESRVTDVFARIDGALGRDGHAVLVRLADAIQEACRDVSAALVGRPAGEVRVREIMRTRVGAVAPAVSLAYAAQTMDALGARELPVVDDSRVVGILTRWDMQPHHGQFEWTPVRTAMTRTPVAIGPEATVGEAARLMVQHCWNSLPVIDDGRLLGMISRGDVLRVLAGESPG
ncbi:MAG: CBS domain-containing protein [Candidatus Binatia bacterium]